MFTYPYLIIKRKLQTDIPELRELAWYTNQDSTKDKDGAITTTPGVYITFPEVKPQTMSGTKIQQATAKFEAMLLSDCVLEGDKRMKKDQPTDHMILMDKIFRSLQGFSALISYLPDFAGLAGTKNDQRSFNSLTRIGITPPHLPRKALMKSAQTFRGLFFDHGAAKLYTSMPKPPMELETVIDIPRFPTFDQYFDETFD